MKYYLLFLGCKRGLLCSLAVILEEGGGVFFFSPQDSQLPKEQ